MLYFSSGSPTTELSDADLRHGLETLLDRFGPANRVLAVPPEAALGVAMAEAVVAGTEPAFSSAPDLVAAG